MSMLAYTGVGSRQTPSDILERMHSIAARLAGAGFTLRSGGAPGADSAFEEGATTAGGQREIYLPWAGFNGRQQGIVRQSLAAEVLAREVHPAWAALAPAARRLHVRNCHQVLGFDLLTPSLFVVCWTPDGCVGAASRTRATGGTATAIVVAERFAVPVFNLQRTEDEMRLDRALKAADASRWGAFALDEPVSAE